MEVQDLLVRAAIAQLVVFVVLIVAENLVFVAGRRRLKKENRMAKQPCTVKTPPKVQGPTPQKPSPNSVTVPNPPNRISPLQPVKHNPPRPPQKGG